MAGEELTAVVSCDECREALGSVTARRSEIGPMLASLIACCHATQPHCAHRLIAEIVSIVDSLEERDLVVRCLHPGCETSEQTRTRCPIELVAALTLLHHTSHEGHRLELTYGDRSWQSPQAPKHPFQERMLRRAKM